LDKKKLGNKHIAMAEKFQRVPGSPIIYWASEDLLEVYRNTNFISDYARGIQGIITGDNAKHVRNWHEVNRGASLVPPAIFDPSKRAESYWVPYAKGGDYRKWYGNGEHLLFWR